jgi:hypothetical protein
MMFSGDHLGIYLESTEPDLLDQTFHILVICRPSILARLQIRISAGYDHFTMAKEPRPSTETLCLFGGHAGNVMGRRHRDLAANEQINMREADIEIWMALLDISGTIFYNKTCCSEEVMASIPLAMFVARKEGRHLKWMTEEMRAKKMVVLEAVKQHYMAINYASEDLKYDHDVIALARADMFDRRQPPGMSVAQSLANTHSPWRSQSALPMARDFRWADDATMRVFFAIERMRNREQERLRRRLPIL